MHFVANCCKTYLRIFVKSTSLIIIIFTHSKHCYLTSKPNHGSSVKNAWQWYTYIRSQKYQFNKHARMQGCYNSRIDRSSFLVSNCWCNISFWMEISISGVLCYLFGSGVSGPKSIHERNSGFDFLSTDQGPKTDKDSASQCMKSSCYSWDMKVPKESCEVTCCCQTKPRVHFGCLWQEEKKTWFEVIWEVICHKNVCYMSTWIEKALPGAKFLSVNDTRTWYRSSELGSDLR